LPPPRAALGADAREDGLRSAEQEAALDLVFARKRRYTNSSIAVGIDTPLMGRTMRGRFLLDSDALGNLRVRLGHAARPDATRMYSHLIGH
jgi:hypothetical protein